jgi:hypothetical protein
VLQLPSRGTKLPRKRIIQNDENARKWHKIGNFRLKTQFLAMKELGFDLELFQKSFKRRYFGLYVKFDQFRSKIPQIKKTCHLTREKRERVNGSKNFKIIVLFSG